MEDPTQDQFKNPEDNHDTSKDPIYAARDHDKKVGEISVNLIIKIVRDDCGKKQFQFDPVEYLEGFYKTAKEDEAMQIVLFFLPGVLYRIPNMIENLLDLGAGKVELI